MDSSRLSFLIWNVLHYIITHPNIRWKMHLQLICCKSYLFFLEKFKQVGKIIHVLLKRNLGVSVFIHFFEEVQGSFFIRLIKTKENARHEAFTTLWNNVAYYLYGLHPTDLAAI